MADFTLSEEWRPVEGWPYDVSSLGRVRRATDAISWRGGVMFPKGSILKPSPTDSERGYLRVSLLRVSQSGPSKITARIARLVCEAFHGPKPSPAHQVAHWDGDPRNNQAGNVRWATSKENHADRDRHGTSFKGSRNPSAILREADVLTIKSLLAAGIPQVRVAERYGVTIHCINDISTRRAWAWL